MRSLIVAILLVLGATATAAQDRVRLEVYSTLEVENLKDFKTAFEAENRDIEILWNRDSTGVITARILAEQGAQRADAVAAANASAAPIIHFFIVGSSGPFFGTTRH